jgi:hypothetical protein
MTDRASRARRDAIRAEYAAEEAGAAEAEALENEQAVVWVRGQGPLMLDVELRCPRSCQVQVQLLRDRPACHVASGSTATCWNATGALPAASCSTSQ